ncbi:Putative TrmH family tRNA/rRNA methyltransferase [Dermatophilus congolensis]|uniref:TrmH family tRNA/rRNA methyltransferase n=1 Tax=Dermatophilus congolensis TaxID=1863 RepID=A0AA46BLK1_9MICO|nr:23S rRNA (guanosine(2251)-2'-O)-methyltransferase RlmB [Dermatophilus congolensis]STD04446.1 Putative TrmH family tRNA/rRNA methyltransferase [Dermatophilus congolensis]
MAGTGNSRKRGAVRKPGSKKGMVVGSGGQRRKGLEGKGPTPKAEDRPYHKAYKAKQAALTRAKTRTAAPGKRPHRDSDDVIMGRNAVLEALREDMPIITLYISGKVDEPRLREAVALATEKGIPVLDAPRGEMERITDSTVHQGIAAKMKAYKYADIESLIHPEDPFDRPAGVPLVVALDGITDTRNLGAIIRSAAAFGAHGIVLPERRSVTMTAAAWKTSAGAAARVPVASVTNLTRTLEQFRKAGYFVIGLDMDGDVGLPDLQLADTPLVVVVGSEGKGMSRLVRETCDQVVDIPMSGEMESLNASVAAGITLYQVAATRAAVRR